MHTLGPINREHPPKTAAELRTDIEDLDRAIAEAQAAEDAARQGRDTDTAQRIGSRRLSLIVKRNSLLEQLAALGDDEAERAA